MSVDLIFDSREAESKGVQFTPIFREVFIGDATNEDEFFIKENFEKKVVGYNVLCPNGAEGFAIMDELFQCKNINSEIKEWFLENLKTATII